MTKQNDCTDAAPDVSDLEETTRFLFGCDYDADDFDSYGDEIHEKLAAKVCKSHPWRSVYDSWVGYLMGECPTPESVVNWENLFWYYSGADFKLRNPYPLLGYLLYRTATPEGEYIETDDDIEMVFDGIAMCLLQHIGDVTIGNIDDFAANQDPKILAAAADWREKLGPAPGIDG